MKTVRSNELKWTLNTARLTNTVRGTLTTLTVIAVACFVPLYAHGGEDHEDATTTVQSGSSTHTAAAQSESFDVVVKYASAQPSIETMLDIYLADYETNTPVANATIEVSVAGIDTLTRIADAETDPGLYSVKIIFPKSGVYELVLDITAGINADIISIKGIDVGTEASEVSQSASYSRLTIAVFSLIAIAVAILVVLLLKKKKHTGISAATMGILVLLLTPRSAVFAHGGEEHGGEASPAADQGAPGYMSKGSQFLLGVRTVVVETRDVNKQINALGRIVAPPRSQVQVYSPQAGLLVSSVSVSYPNVGDWVSKGQPIAVVQLLDEFVIRAPISGVVTAVHAVPGEQIEPSHELYSIFDNSAVWVEANLFESELAHLEKQPKATVSWDAFPEEAFKAQFLNFDYFVDPSTRTLKAIYLVENFNKRLRPGLVVNVYIETQSLIDVLAVPASSVMDWEGTKVVFVHVQPELFEMRPVKIVGYYGSVVVVEGGVREGDRVVTTGAYELLSIPHRFVEGVK